MIKSYDATHIQNENLCKTKNKAKHIDNSKKTKQTQNEISHERPITRMSDLLTEKKNVLWYLE